MGLIVRGQAVETGLTTFHNVERGVISAEKLRPIVFVVGDPGGYTHGPANMPGERRVFCGRELQSSVQFVQQTKKQCQCESDKQYFHILKSYCMRMTPP